MKPLWCSVDSVPVVVCPEELKEAVSGLLYAAPRCGEFPELREIRAILTTRFRNEFSAIESKMIQKLSAKEPGLEMRMKVLEEIARENGIVLLLEKFDSSDLDSPSSQPELAG
ncbi:putative vacuolar protein sorting-associated protein Ist1 [Helianthus annuus]|nr:putative vacuolar protein sorting-associated protein Ist1 [Helianthus annuus]